MEMNALPSTLSRTAVAEQPLPTPPTQAVLGVPLALTDYERTLDWIDAAVAAGIARVHLRRRRAHRDGLPGGRGAARRRARRRASPCPTASRSCGRCARSATSSGDRVYGPELMDRACARAARTGQRMYLYGGRNQGALAQLTRTLRLRHPGLKIVGGYAPPFRPLTDAEEEHVAHDINRSGADVVWVGIGVPKQEKWMARMRPRLKAPVLIGVGAAFDFHAGLVPQAPAADAALRPRVAVPASRRSRAGCGSATRGTTRCSWSASRASTPRHRRAALASDTTSCATTSPSSGSAASACRSPSASPTAGCRCSAWTPIRTACRPSASGGCRSRSRARTS